MNDLYGRLQSWLWSDEPHRTRAGAAGMTIARFGYALLRDFAAGDLNLRAMSLVYTTTLAAVPLLAFCFSVLKGLGFHRELEPLLLNLLAPLESRAEEITSNIIGFVDNVSSSGLATVSLILLVVTALQMAQKVEVSFNFVWRVDRPRSFARRFSDYLSVMLVGPVLMSVTLGLIATVASTTLMNRLRGMRPFGDLLAGLSTLTPYVLMTAAFTLLYLFVPNTRVRTRAALVGGAFAGLLWAGSGYLFTALVVNTSRYEAIYSGFAIVIIAMWWLYFSWLILLIGAQLAFYVQNPEYLRFGHRGISMSNSLRERLALHTMLLVGQDFDEPRHGWRVESLASRMRVPRHLLEPVVAALMQARLLTETTEHRLMPAKDLHRMTLLEIIGAVRAQSRDYARPNRESSDTVQALAERIELALRDALKGETLADLIEREGMAEAAEPAPHSTAADPRGPRATRSA